MSDLDSTTALAENKVLILYVLNKIPDGTLESALYKIVSSANDMNYFYFKDILSDLIESNLVGILSNDDEDLLLKITEEGKNSLSLTIAVLPGIIKLKADNIFKEELISINNETAITSEVIPKSENNYTIKCKITENNETIFEVKTYAGSRERSQKIVDNWNKNASKIYPKILDILLEDDSEDSNK